MRCYNGCPDSALQAVLDSRAKAKKDLAEKIPGARAVYFPSPGFWQVFSSDYKFLSDECGSVEQACHQAISRS